MHRKNLGPNPSDVTTLTAEANLCVLGQQTTHTLALLHSHYTYTWLVAAVLKGRTGSRAKSGPVRALDPTEKSLQR